MGIDRCAEHKNGSGVWKENVAVGEFRQEGNGRSLGIRFVRNSAEWKKRSSINEMGDLRPNMLHWTRLKGFQSSKHHSTTSSCGVLLLGGESEGVGGEEALGAVCHIPKRPVLDLLQLE